MKGVGGRGLYGFTRLEQKKVNQGMEIGHKYCSFQVLQFYGFEDVIYLLFR